MPKTVMIDEIHLSVFVRKGLEAAEANAITRSLNATRFRADLRRAVQTIFRRYSALRTARFTITR